MLREKKFFWCFCFCVFIFENRLWILVEILVIFYQQPHLYLSWTWNNYLINFLIFPIVIAFNTSLACNIFLETNILGEKLILVQINRLATCNVSEKSMFFEYLNIASQLKSYTHFYTEANHIEKLQPSLVFSALSFFNYNDF